MTNIEIIANFEREINKLDDTFGKPATDDSLYWLNQAVVKFIKQRFNGNIPHLTSYEQNEKRTRDLINLYKEGQPDFISTNSDHPSYVEYTYTYPADMMYMLNENVIIEDTTSNSTDRHPMDTCVFECTADNFMYRVNNSLTDFHYKHYKARPLRIRFLYDTIDGPRQACKLLTDGLYSITEYTVGYIRQPKLISLESPLDEYSEFPEYVLPEIIKIAAQMYIENLKDARYQTITNEVNTQE